MEPTGSEKVSTSSSGGAQANDSGLPENILLEDFRQQCTNLQNQYTRMHGRMQLITGLNTALLPALGALAVAAGRKEVGLGWLLLFPTAGLLLSMIGYVAGSGDHFLVDLYREQLARAAVGLVHVSPVSDPQGIYNRWIHAGMSPSEVDGILHSVGAGRDGTRDGSRNASSDIPRWWDRLTSRRRDWLSVTRLPAALSLVFFVVWLVVLVVLAAVVL